DRGVSILVAFDWAEAGRGVPPVDILGRFGHGVYRSSAPDIYTYWSVARKLWTLPSMETMKRFESVVKAYRAISTYGWESAFRKPNLRACRLQIGHECEGIVGRYPLHPPSTSLKL